MAKSKNFFGKRKGSTKSLTFSTLSINGNRTQITKDRVKYVKNPNTEAQQWQRAKAKAIADMAPMFPYLYKYWPPYTRKFSLSEIRQNPFYRVNLGKNGISEIYTIDDTNKMIADAVISNGYYSTDAYLRFYPHDSNAMFGIPNFAEQGTAFTPEVYRNLLFKAGFQIGDILQLTGIFRNPISANYLFVNWAVDLFDFTNAAIASDYVEYTKSYTNPHVIVRLLCDSYTSYSLSFHVGFYNNGGYSFVFYPIAAAYIVINNNQNTRSRMQINPNYVGTYLTKWSPAINDKTSNLYLNTGLDGVDINGGSTAAVVEAVNKANAAKANAAKEYRKKLENEFLQNEMLEGTGLSDTIIQ